MDKQDLVLKIGKVATQGFEMHGKLFNQAKQLIKKLALLNGGEVDVELWLSFVDGQEDPFCIRKVYVNVYGEVMMSGNTQDGDYTEYDLYSLPDGGIFYLCDEIYEKYIKE